jgi:hypothetical protein
LVLATLQVSAAQGPFPLPPYLDSGYVAKTGPSGPEEGGTAVQPFEVGSDHYPFGAGWLTGVMLPSLRHLLGVLALSRLPFIVAQGGVVQACVMVIVCIVSAVLTTFALSAMATTGRITGSPSLNGPFAFSLRSLGPEAGGVVGLGTFLVASVTSGLYILGAVEAIKFESPKNKISKHEIQDVRLQSVIACTVLVLLGVIISARRLGKWFGPLLALAGVLASVSAIIGFTQYENGDKCVLRLSGEPFTRPDFRVNLTDVARNRTAEQEAQNLTSASPVPVIPGDAAPAAVPGLPGSAGGVPSDAIVSPPALVDSRNPISVASLVDDPSELLLPWFNGTDLERDPAYLLTCVGISRQKLRDARSSDYTEPYSFIRILALFYPTVAGFFLGSLQRSGELARPGLAVPIGTMTSIFIASGAYFGIIVLSGASWPRKLLLLKENLLVTSIVSWPDPWVVRIFIMIIGFGEALVFLADAFVALYGILSSQLFPGLASLFPSMQGARGAYLKSSGIVDPTGAAICATITFLTAGLTVMGGSMNKVAPVATVP